MNKMKKILPIIGAALVAGGILTAGIKVKADENKVIPDHIYIENVAVGGMTAEEAEEAVEAYVEQNKEAEFTLTAGVNSVAATVSDLGVEWENTSVVEEALNYTTTGNLLERYKAKKDLENEDKVFRIEYSIDEEASAKFIEEHADELDQEAIDNGLVRENGAFTIIKGQEGVQVDEEASVEALKEYFAKQWTGGDDAIELVAEIVEPQGTEEDLNKVQDLLGSFSTDFSTSSAGRSANVKNAVSKINGTVLYPDEEFSVYDTIAPMNAENGYELAGSYENGTTVETYGGGVCQVSTTLYNAVIRSELEVTERYAHSMIVAYVKPSMDAAIAGELKNLKFKNNTEAPIYIEGYCSNGIVYFNIFGEETRDANREVSFISETLSSEEAPIEVVTTDAPVGVVEVTQKAHTGINARLWKVVTVNGKEVSRDVFNESKYKASPRIISVGMSSASPDAIAAMNAAIATNDEETIRAVAAEWSAEAIAAREAGQATVTPPTPTPTPDPVPEEEPTTPSGEGEATPTP